VSIDEIGRAARRAARPYDVVFFGATGYVGALVAEYLAKARPPSLRWALAGRSVAKLERVREGLAAADASLASLPLLTADSGDAASLDALAASARVVCTTVGPYATFGRGLAGACARAGTDYCDLNGELGFARDLVDSFDSIARESGARIVPSCGFDAIPSDLGVFALHEHFAARGGRLASARLYVEELKAAISGGSLASLVTSLEQARRDGASRRLAADPYALVPDRERDRGPDGGDLTGVAWDRDVGAFVGPFVMAAYSTRVVRRTNALLGWAYGRDFRYSEVTRFSGGPVGLARALGLAAGLRAFLAALSTPLVRGAIAKWMPKPGDGPTKEQRDRGGFRVRIVGRGAPDSVGRAAVVVEGRSDPGYGETAIMLGESALCLAFDELPARAGVLTTASAMGAPLLTRLRRAGMGFRVEERR